MEFTRMEDWEQSGKISAAAREYGRGLCVVGALVLDIAEKVEQKIIQLGGKPAFPVDVSINSLAAHVSPFPDETTALQKGDLVKLDLGAHINGHVTDTACTIEVGGTTKQRALIKATEDAVAAAIKVAQPGVAVNEVGRVVQEVIVAAGFTPVRNLSGHGVGLWEVHTAPTIPNYPSGDLRKLEAGVRIAIEPFATPGIGFVKDGKPSGVYAFVNERPVRMESARKLLTFIKQEYRTLPFSIRWVKHFQNYRYLLGLLEKEGVIMQYPQLPEKSDALVSQAEHTIEIGKGILTK